MSDESSSAAAWSARLEPAAPPDDLPRRPDDPRLGSAVEFWGGGALELRPGRAALVGFPFDEGVRRNGGRPGAAEAPREVRRWLYRMTPWDAEADVDLSPNPPLDLGDVRGGGLEEAQQALGEVVGEVLRRGAVPVVLGGGHETAYGHYLGHVAADSLVGVINIDAHLDVRPTLDGLGHSGSPFRQAMEHPSRPLPANRYVCLGAQPHCLAREHWRYLSERGGAVRWCSAVRKSLVKHFLRQAARLAAGGCRVYVSIDADVVHAAEVPGVSAPNPLGLSGHDVAACARAAGASPQVAGIDLVEINPRLDPDGRSARWAALTVWHFLIGLAMRPAG